MLSSANAQQLQKWFEFYQLEPFGDEWAQTSLIATEFGNVLLQIMAAFSGAQKEQIPIVPCDAFVPHRYTKEQFAAWFPNREISVTDTNRVLSFFKGLTGNGF